MLLQDGNHQNLKLPNNQGMLLSGGKSFTNKDLINGGQMFAQENMK